MDPPGSSPSSDARGALILAIETSTPTARVAVLDAAGARRAAREATAARHSSNLLRLCDEALREAAVASAALAAIACGAGPGSFTGLRVGLAVAKGLALPSERPLVLISSLAALALDILGTLEAAEPAGAIAAPCIDAGKGQIYVGFFRHDDAGLVVALSEEWVLDPAELLASAPAAVSLPLLVAGNGAERHAEIIDRALAARAHALAAR